MILRIPFTERRYIIGKKAIAESKEAYSFGVNQNTFAGLANSSSMRISFKTLYTIYNNLVDVKQAIRKKSSATMRSGYKFLNSTDNEKTISQRDNERLSSILNYHRTFSTLKDIWVRDLEIAGNAYWQVVEDLNGNILGLRDIDPRTMYVSADQFGNVTGYVQRVTGCDSVYFRADEIIHSIMDYSTDNPLLGVSPIESIIWEGKTEMSAMMSQFYFYENNAVPSHLMILEGKLTEKQNKQLKKDVQEKFGGVKKAFKSAIIPFIKDIKTISPSQKDMQLIASRKFTVKKIVVAFGVDSFILGYTEGVQRSNAQFIYKSFYENTIKPLETYFEEIVNKFITNRLKIKNVTFTINESSFQDAKDLEDRSRADVEKGIMTINEARQVRGLKASNNDLAEELLIGGSVLDDLAFEEVEALKSFKVAVEKKEIKANNLL